MTGTDEVVADDPIAVDGEQVEPDDGSPPGLGRGWTALMWAVLAVGLVLGFCFVNQLWLFAPDDPVWQIEDCWPS